MEALEAIRRFAEEIGHSPKKEEFERADSTPSIGAVARATRLSFTEARLKAGLEPPHEHDERKVTLDVDYFEEITTPDRAYWLGTLFGHSAFREANRSRAVIVSHTERDAHHTEGLHEAIGAGYRISNVERPGEQDRVQFAISNGQFLSHLESHGLDDSGKNVASLPELPEDLRRHFLRGFFEVRGRVGNGSLTVRSNHREKLETARDWIESLDVKRTKVSEVENGNFVLRVGSIFDVAQVLENCWAGIEDESARSERFYRDATEEVCEEHAFPEDLSFCGASEDGADESSSEGVDDDPTPDEHGEDEGRVERRGERDADDYGVGGSVAVPTTLVVAAGLEDDEEFSELASRCVREAVAELVTTDYPDESPVGVGPEATVEIDLDLPRPTVVAVRSVVDDPRSPFESLSELVVSAVSERADRLDGRGGNLSVDGETAALLETLGDGDASVGASIVVSELAAKDT